MKINILLSTYNGEKYLLDQIKSIQTQTFTDWILLIRDDGSIDQTPEIIKNVIQSDRRIHFINSENRQNLGVICSFYELVKAEDADFYFFCDQDDVWLPQKLQIMLDEAVRQNNDIPIMYYSDLKVVAQDLSLIKKSLISDNFGRANTELSQELTGNTVTGCASMINSALANQWQDCTTIIMHDWYLALIASAVGKLIYINVPTVLYRQHGSNVVGNEKKISLLKQFFQLDYWIRWSWSEIDNYQKQANSLLNLSDLSSNNKKIIDDFVHILDYPFWKRAQLLQLYDFKRRLKINSLVFHFLILSKYNRK